MVSRLEHILLLYGQRESDIRGEILGSVDDGGGRSLRTLRSVSRVMLDLVDHHPSRTFHSLYMTIPFTNYDSLQHLQVLAPYCRHLTITVKERAEEGQHTNAKSAGSSPLKTASLSSWEKTRRRSVSILRRASADKPMQPSTSPLASEDSLSSLLQASIISNLLLSILPHLTSLQTLTIRLPDSHTPVWPGQTVTERILLALRTTLESIYTSPPFPLSNLTNLVLSPIHPTGLFHLNWMGLSSFSACSPAPINTTYRQLLWQNITDLTLYLFLPPPPSSPFPDMDVPAKTQQARDTMIHKLLQTYLKSFSATLRHLTFSWIPSPSSTTENQTGPSPFLLLLRSHSSPSSKPTVQQPSTPPPPPPPPLIMHFPHLHTLRLRNVTGTELARTIRECVPTSMPKLQSLFVAPASAQCDGKLKGKKMNNKNREKNKRYEMNGLGRWRHQSRKGGAKGENGFAEDWVEIDIAYPPAEECRIVGSRDCTANEPWTHEWSFEAVQPSTSSSTYSRDESACVFVENRRKGGVVCNDGSE